MHLAGSMTSAMQGVASSAAGEVASGNLSMIMYLTLVEANT
ncbi:hypothetical protein MIDIC_10057 [Alphaproteobacteria bacterium]